MAKKYRRRPGVDDDVVWETRGFLSRLLCPESWNFGWYPLCNSASARNQHEADLNKLHDMLLKKLSLWAESCAAVKNDRIELEEARAFNNLGIARPIRLSDQEVKSMMPMTDAVEPRWKDILQSQVITRALAAHGLKPEGVRQNQGPKIPDRGKPSKPTLTVTTEAGAASLRAEGNYAVEVSKTSKQSAGDVKSMDKAERKQLRKKLIGANPKNEGEDDGTYNRRIDLILKKQFESRQT